MIYTDFINKLYSYSDEKHKEFSTTLSGSTLKVIGLKIPILKKLVKENYQDENLKLTDFNLNSSIEETLCFFLIGILRCKSFIEQLDFLDKYLRYANGWMITDTIPQFLKKASFDVYFPYFLKFSSSSETFKRRFAYVLAIKFYRDEKSLQFLPYIKTDSEYYVMMAEAWFLATMYISFPDNVISILKDDKIDVVLRRKTISKICDSYRISLDDKERVKIIRDNMKK